MSEEHELDQEAWVLQEATADEAERERWAGRLRKVAARWRAEGNPLAVELEAVVERLGAQGASAAADQQWGARAVALEAWKNWRTSHEPQGTAVKDIYLAGFEAGLEAARGHS